MVREVVFYGVLFNVCVWIDLCIVVLSLCIDYLRRFGLRMGLHNYEKF